MISLLDNIQIILVGITHPGNIGAAARAMKNMGLSHLRLVQPAHFPSTDATARAAGADDLLVNAQLFNSYEESLRDCQLIIGTSARYRNIEWPVCTPRECAQKALAMPGKVAILFGREQSGLTNQELDHCHVVVHIPTNPTFSSLNVAAAVQILAYELKVKSDELSIETENNLLPVTHLHPSEEIATAETMFHFYQHLEQTMIELEFLDPQKPKHLMRRLKRLFNRARPINSEINILRGILSAAQAQRRKKGETGH